MNKPRIGYASAIVAVLWQLASGCGSNKAQLDALYGKASPYNRVSTAEASVDFTQVQSIVTRRCVVCHGCYDSPCQLKFTAFEGIERGASKDYVYDTARLRAASPTRLFEDAHSVSEWRGKGFFPALNERDQHATANLKASVLYRMLDLKREGPLPETQRLEGFDFSIDRKQTCPTIEEFPKYAKNFPLGGMPYGMPALTPREFQVIEAWIAQGAVRGPEPALPDTDAAHIAKWEQLLNGDSLKAQLIGRYLYEHLYLFHLYFDEEPEGRFFSLVRSKTPPGAPVERIATRRPYNDPQVSRVYYRILPVKETILVKTHIPYAMNDARAQRWNELFFEAHFSVESLPSYENDEASNPFVTFRDLPTGSRYNFLLDDALQIVMAYIKGTVCRGHVALNVIDDHFWIFFMNPELFQSESKAKFLNSQAERLDLPASKGSNAAVLWNWVTFSRKQKAYLKAKSEYAEEYFAGEGTVDLPIVWNGNGQNRNAVLSVFRGRDNATVVQGMVGDAPKTAWLLGYGTLERIYYLLVAGYDVFGSVGHQLNTRIYMDFLRMEGEAQFLALLPKAHRKKELDFWYRGAKKTTKDYVLGEIFSFDAPSKIAYQTDDPKRELFGLLRAHLGDALSQRYELKHGHKNPDVFRALRRVAWLRGGGVSVLPEMSLLSIVGDNGETRHFSMLVNRGYRNVTVLMGDASQRLPNEDTLTIVPGVLGSYPNAFFRIEERNINAFANDVVALKSEDDYAKLLNRYGVRRTSPTFWQHSDDLHRDFQASDPLDFGILDYNRVENR